MKRQTEQRALAALQGIVLVVIVGSLIFFLVKKSTSGDTQHDATDRPRQVASADAPLATSTTTSLSSSPAPQNIPFDPNTADSAMLVRVGFTPFQARNILKYRSKGGQYHRAEDIKRVYSLTMGQWEHLEPLIRIGKKYQYLSDNEDVYARHTGRREDTQSRNESSPSISRNEDSSSRSAGQDGNATSRSFGQNEGSPFHSANRIPKLRAGEHIDLNHADTTALQSIPGIGPYYARRIAQYGEKLGGYISVDQLNDSELDFLPPGIEDYLTLSARPIKKLRINRLSVRELYAHPYLTYPQAKQINQRVRLYGPLQSWDDILFLSEFTEKDKKRLEPYVSFE